MQIHHMDMENADFADHLIRALENDYGRKVNRIAKFKTRGRYSWYISVIFMDFTLLEAILEIVTPYPGADPQIELEGVYY